MEANYVHKDTLTATDYVELNKNNELLISYNQALLKENQELKKRLKVPKACNLKTLEDYKSYYEDTTREQILEDTYIEYCAYVNLAHRYSELKKQLEEKKDYIKKLQATKDKLDKWDYKNTLQQAKFIKYLEKEIKTLEKDILETIDDMDIYMKQVKSLIIEEILQKYKEMNGVDK